MRRRLALLVAVAILALVPVAARPVTVAASAGASGYDISWPQCGQAYPARPYDLGIVGVTGGHGFSSNPCLASEDTWASQAPTPPELYVNVDLPSTTPAQGRTGPAGSCASGDTRCYAYNYGYNNAQYALSYASQQQVDARVWWLDVETNNNWQTSAHTVSSYRTARPATPDAPAAYQYDNAANARSVEGTIDGLLAAGKTVGAYSTNYQWNLLVGSYTPMVSTWYATAGDQAHAPNYCDQGHAFAGGPVWMVQYAGSGFDADYECTPPLSGIHLAAITASGHGGSAIAVDDNAMYAAASTGSSFGPITAVTRAAFYGSRATVFAPLDGRGSPESGVAFNDSSTYVMRNTAGTLGPIQEWSATPFYGSRLTTAAVVDASGLPAAVAINDASIWVMRQSGGRFGSPTQLSNTRFFGTRGTYMAVLDSGGLASAVAVNDNSIWVMRNVNGALQPPTQISGVPFYGTRGVYLADIDGHGFASAVAMNESSIWVERNNGSGPLGSPVQVSSDTFFGTWQYLADVDGSGRASVVAVSPSGISVKQNNGGSFGKPVQWLSSALWGDH